MKIGTECSIGVKFVSKISKREYSLGLNSAYCRGALVVLSYPSLGQDIRRFSWRTFMDDHSVGLSGPKGSHTLHISPKAQ